MHARSPEGAGAARSHGPDRRGALLAEYGEVANNFRLLTDIRFRLLAFLPIAAGTAAGLLAASTSRDPASEMRALVLSLFGLIVTAALATYNERNDQLYDTLVRRAAYIERELGLPDGAFAHRPIAWFRPLGWPVNHRWAVALIYGSSATLWLYSAAAAVAQLRVDGERSATDETLLIAAGAAVVVTALAGTGFYLAREARHSAMCACADAAVTRVKSHSGRLCELARNSDFLEECQGVGGIDAKKVKKRIEAYTEPGREDRNHLYMLDGSFDDVDRAAAFVALLCDMPPQWIADCHTGRRAS